MHGGGTAAGFLGSQSGLPAARVADAMFALLDGSGRLYGMSMEEKHLKVLENARASFAVYNTYEEVDALMAGLREVLRLFG